MKWPGKSIETAPESNVVPPEDWYDVALTGNSIRRAARGAWITFEEKIDSGDHQGYKVEQDFWIPDDGQKMDTTYAHLGNICRMTGFWPDIPDGEEIDPEAFILLWPTDGSLRWRVHCEHEHTIKAYLDVDSYKSYTRSTPEETPETPFSKWLTVEKAVADAWKEKGGQVFVKLRPAKVFGIDIPTIYQKAGEKEPEPVATNGEMEFIADDDLPF